MLCSDDFVLRRVFVRPAVRKSNRAAFASVNVGGSRRSMLSGAMGGLYHIALHRYAGLIGSEPHASVNRIETAR